MSEFGEHVQGITTPYTQANERNAVTRIESGPRLPAHADSTVAILYSEVALRLGPGLLHALHDRHPDGRLDRSTPAQSLPAGAVALSRARSTNPEIFRRG